MASVIPRRMPWASWSEWHTVHAGVMSEWWEEREWALRRMAAWEHRGGMPHAAAATAYLLDALQRRQDGSIRSELQERLMLSMAIIRAVNGLVDASQRAARAQPISVLASRMGLPAWLVDVRHEATHNSLPTLSALRSAADAVLQWLFSHYWQRQSRFVSQAAQHMQRALHDCVLACCAVMKNTATAGPQPTPLRRTALRAPALVALVRVQERANAVALVVDAGALRGLLAPTAVWGEAEPIAPTASDQRVTSSTLLLPANEESFPATAQGFRRTLKRSYGALVELSHRMSELASAVLECACATLAQEPEGEGGRLTERQRWLLAHWAQLLLSVQFLAHCTAPTGVADDVGSSVVASEAGEQQLGRAACAWWDPALYKDVAWTFLPASAPDLAARGYDLPRLRALCSASANAWARKLAGVFRDVLETAATGADAATPELEAGAGDDTFCRAEENDEAADTAALELESAAGVEADASAALSNSAATTAVAAATAVTAITAITADVISAAPPAVSLESVEAFLSAAPAPHAQRVPAPNHAGAAATAAAVDSMATHRREVAAAAEEGSAGEGDATAGTMDTDGAEATEGADETEGGDATAADEAEANQDQAAFASDAGAESAAAGGPEDAMVSAQTAARNAARVQRRATLRSSKRKAPALPSPAWKRPRAVEETAPEVYADWLLPEELRRGWSSKCCPPARATRAQLSCSRCCAQPARHPRLSSRMAPCHQRLTRPSHGRAARSGAPARWARCPRGSLPISPLPPLASLLHSWMAVMHSQRPQLRRL